MAGKAESQLTAKQALFVQEYLVDLNATQAAIRAGYSAKTGNTTASEYLARPRIAAAIAEEFAKRSARLEIDQDRVMLELARIGFSDLRDLVTWDEKRATYVPPTELTADQACGSLNSWVVHAVPSGNRCTTSQGPPTRRSRSARQR